jgi:protein involved in polysaccharide export with SLBB domain
MNRISRSAALLLLVFCQGIHPQTTNTPATVPAPVGSDPAQATLDTRRPLGVGDQITFRIVEDRDPARSLTVLDSGEIDVPYIGRVQAAGKTCQELAAHIKPLLERDYYHQATVLIAMDSQRQSRGRIYIFGAVSQQGPMNIPVDEVFTVSKALLRAGGFAANADRQNIRIERQSSGSNQRETLTCDLVQVLEGGQTQLDIVLQPNDLVVVPSSATAGRITVVGEVHRAGPIDFPLGSKMSVSSAILAAGGFKQFANKGKVRIIRRTGPETGDKKEIVVDVGAILEKGRLENDVDVQPGDMIIVPERLINF